MQQQQDSHKYKFHCKPLQQNLVWTENSKCMTQETNKKVLGTVDKLEEYLH